GRTLERPCDARLSDVDALRGDVLLLRWVEVAGSDQGDIVNPDRARVDEHPERHPPQVSRRRAVWRVEVAVGVEPDHAQSVLAGCQTLDRADVRATAAAEYPG